MTTLKSPPNVRVFKNYSLGGYTILQATRVLAHAREVRLADVEFRVRESGRQRMITRRTRTIHAYAVGQLIDFVRLDETDALPRLDGRVADYNPYRYGHFYDAVSEDALFSATIVQLEPNRIVYSSASHEPPLAA